MNPKPAVEKQSFYMEPPFSYRPSVAEFLSTIKVTKNGILADLMHLDKKGKLNIERYFSDSIEVKLKDNSDLNDNELFLWEFLEKKATGKTAKLKFSELNSILGKYEKLVLKNCEGKFGSNFPFNPTAIPGGFIILGFLASFVLSFITSIISIPFSLFLLIIATIPDVLVRTSIQVIFYLIMLSIPFIIIYKISANKISRSRIERKFLFKEIMLDVLKLQLLSYGLAVILVLGFFALLSSFLLFALAWVVIIPALLVVLVFYWHFFGKITFKFLYWYFETKETAQHRKRWLMFKDFIIDYSEIEKKPLKHYELWDEFYYYALAVGAIKKPF